MPQGPPDGAESPTRRQNVGGGWTVTEHAVLIVGGGPTGLMLAAELALAGVDVAIVERRASQEGCSHPRKTPEGRLSG